MDRLDRALLQEGATQTDRAYSVLRANIMKGELAPGYRLRVADLQARYGFGLTPLREALMRLASEGFVESETHRGARVSSLSWQGLSDLIDARIEVESMCLRRSIQFGGASWEAEVLASAHLLSRLTADKAASDPDGLRNWESMQRRFHSALVAGCKSEWLLKIWNMLYDHCDRYTMTFLRARSEIGPLAEIELPPPHSEIAEAVLARQTERATDLLAKHLTAFDELVRRQMAPRET
jgi:GntR family transcriptional regulator, carbon starvation induced regulator